MSPRKSQRITDESSAPAEPLVTMGPVASPATRTGLQLITGEFIVQGVEAFDVVALTDTQRAWLVVALGILLAVIQNTLERWRGRRLIGTA